MDIELIKELDMVTAIINGNIDSDGTQKLAENLQKIKEIDNANKIIFDLQHVNTITSAGIGKLLNFFKYIDMKRGTMEINGISDNLYSQFNEIHLDRIFPIKK